MPTMAKEDFDRLQKEWYEILKKDGFEDIEELVGTQWKLRTSDTHHVKFVDEVVREAKQRYYELLREAVTNNECDSKIDTFIMMSRSEGVSVPKIVLALQDMGVSRHRSTVGFLIRRYEKRWGIKDYKPSQLTSRRPKKDGT